MLWVSFRVMTGVHDLIISYQIRSYPISHVMTIDLNNLDCEA